MTHVMLDNGEVYEVLNMIDDHSRLCVASRAMNVVKATDVVRVLHKAAETWGYPASFLTDNGLIFSTKRHHQVVGVTEQELFALGIEAKHSKPYHPQTCGKVERFHQTMKKFLAAQEITSQKAAPTCPRPLRHLLQPATPSPEHGAADPGRRLCRPGEGRPSPSFVKVGNRRLRLDRVDRSGRITLRYQGRLHHIGIGNAYAGWRVAMLVDGLAIEIVGLDGSPLRRLTLDPTKDYQRIP